jgi:hypothetical protein
LEFVGCRRKLRRSDSIEECVMAMIPPPEGLSAEDYDAIEAAVVETVRGRWFLAEYARRSRVDELRQMLEGLARLEQTVSDQQLPADPSIRLLVQRLKEVSQRLEGLATDMRANGIAEDYCGDIETQARAVAGLLRGAPPKFEPPRAAPMPQPLPAPPVVPTWPAQTDQGAALTRLDRLSTAEKVVLFS